MIIYEEGTGDGFKWVPIMFIEGDEVPMMVQELVDRVNELGEEVAQLKNEVGQ